MRAVYLSGLLVVVLAAITFWMVSDLQPGVIVLQFAWTPRGFGEIVHVWPPEDLERYRLHLPLDSLLLLAYGSFGWLLATRTALFASLPRLACAAAPFVLPLAAAFDAVENALHAWLTEMPRFGLHGLYLLSTSCSALKWALLFGFYGGFAGTGWHVHLMHLTALVMAAVFLSVAFGPWRAFRSAFDRGDRAGAAAAVERIRNRMQMNLALGVLTIAVAAFGRFV